MNVAILHDAVGPDARADELDVLVQARAVREALAGQDVELVAVSLDLAALRDELVRRRPELVFNLVESLGRSGRLVAAVPLLLEALQMPFTGSGSAATFLSANKLTSKRALRAAGLPTPDWRDEAGLHASRSLPGTWIVKSVWEHGSLGLDDGAVLAGDDPARLRAAIDARRVVFGGEGFAEQFIAGREFNLALIEAPDGLRVLPVAEMRFDGLDPGRPAIVGYAAKWDEQSTEYLQTTRSYDVARGDRELHRELAELARAAWQLFDVRGWARVDFRVDERGRPWILEVNTNPCIAPDAGFAAALAQAGIEYRAAVGWICDAAMRTRIIAPAPRGLRDEPEPDDVEKVRALVAATRFFNDDEVRIAAELVDERLQKGLRSGYWFLLRDDPDEPSRLLGYSCYGPTDGTEASWDLYWIGVDPRAQRAGVGRELMAATEQRIAAAGGRLVYAETAGRAQYAPTRAFYERCGYAVVARYPDFYAPGDDKVVYGKDLSALRG